MTEKKLVKVTFHYNDESEKFIDGNELDKWSGFNRQLAIFATIHKMNPDWESIVWSTKNEKEIIQGELDFSNVKSAAE